MTVTTEHSVAATHSPQRLPEELVESTLFLLKRLGFTAKGKSMSAYEEVGLHPYHFGVLIAVAEGSHATQGAIADSLLRVVTASAVAAGLAYPLWWAIDDALGRSLAGQLVSLGVGLTSAGGAYVLSCRVLRVAELTALRQLLRRPGSRPA